MIEGKVSHDGDKIVIELDSGSVRLEAKSVVRIEKGETAADRIAAQRASLAPTAIVERMALANSCREQRLSQCERELLREVLALETDHAEARARLGYVRAEQGWLSRAEQQRLEQARLASAAQAASATSAVRVAELERDAAELERQKAELALKSQRLALQAAEEERRAREAQANQLAAWPFWTTGPYRYPAHLPSFSPVPPHAAPNYVINGVRDPASYFR